MGRNKQINNIEKLIKKLDEPKEEMPTIDLMMRYEKSLFQAIDDMMPQYLYKYREGNENNLDALVNHRIYLSIPAKLNDPTESMSYVDANTLVMAALSLPNDYVLFDSADSEDAQNSYLSKRTELMNRGLAYIHANRSRVRICSLSEVIDSPLMWTHYANEQRGFAIRYKTDNIIFPECKDCEDPFCHRREKALFPVVYRDERFDATHMALANALNKEICEEAHDSDLPFPLLTVIQKSKDWSYEKEWRVVCNNVNNSFLTLKPDAIFMGELIDDSLACKLANIARRFKIPLYKMEIDYFSPGFNLIYKDWSEYSYDDIKMLAHTDAPEFG